MSKHPSRDTFWSKVTKTNGCWIWNGLKTRDGYGYFNHSGRREAAHRFAYRTSRRQFDQKLCVLHRCDNPPCVRPSHLFQGTQADNIADMMAKGRNRQPKGVRVGIHKLDDNKVREIRALDGVLSTRATAAIYGVGHDIISRVRTRKIWRHVP